MLYAYKPYKYYAALPPKTDFINGVHTNTCRTLLKITLLGVKSARNVELKRKIIF